jgi:hypothetical protein
MKILAKGKIKRQEREREAELQEHAEQRADKLLKDAKPVLRKDRQTDSDVSFKEVRNVMADSIERLWEELHMDKNFRGEEHRRMNAEEAAWYMTGSLMHGLHGHGGVVKIREAEPTPRYCKEHR